MLAKVCEPIQLRVRTLWKISDNFIAFHRMDTVDLWEFILLFVMLFGG